MKKRIRLLLIVFFAGATSFVLAQKTITGKVTSGTDGLPLIGASILEKGTNNGTVTDVDGSFSLQTSSNNAVLTISYTGFVAQDINTTGLSVVNITLIESATLLSEIVVTGYTAQQKKDLTGAVGVVNTEELTKLPSANITNQLQGRVSGVTVSGDGRPGSSAKVRIRGFTSFSGANEPLYIVDGIPTGDISTINPNDIASISVLKDAGAASIYGSAAANGVILIKTKMGSKGVKVNYDVYAGVTAKGKGDPNILNTQEYADLQWLVYKNDKVSETHPFYGPSSNAKPTLPSWAANTDWYDVLTQNANIMNHDLSFSGGNENASFYAGLNYFNQEGVIINNFSKRYSARLNSEFKIANGRITLGENLNVTGRTGFGVSGNGAEDSPLSMGVYRSQPIVPHIITTPVKGTARDFAVGEFGGTAIAPRLGNAANRYADLQRDKDDRQSDIRLLGSLFADYKILEGLNFRSTFGGSWQNGYSTNWSGSTYERAENVATSSYSEESYYNANWTWYNTLTLDRSFGLSKILAVAGFEASEGGLGRGVGSSKAGYFSEDPAFRTVSNGAQITNAYSWFVTPSTTASLFLRADYSFNNRYYVSGTIRRDGSSRFSEDNRYAVFPSVSAGVRVSDFISNLGIISDLKVRGGYGTMGNQAPVDPANQFYLFGGGTGDSNYDLGGTGNSSQKGFRPTRIGNTDTKWETQVTTNVGFDASLFNSALQVSFDWYKKASKDLLVVVPLPSIFGAASAPAVNVGDMKNTGVDLQFDYRTKLTSDLGLNATLTFTTYKNEILKYTNDVDYWDTWFGDSRIGSFTRNQVGRSMSEFFGYKSLGLFQSQAEVDGAPKQDGKAPGFFRFDDTDGDKEITPDDRVHIGNPNPDFTYGLNLGLTWKNFDLTAFFFGSQGNDIFNYNRWWTDFWPSFQGQKSKDLLYNSWTENNKGATTPKASNASNFSTNTQSVSYYVEDGSFFKLKTLQLGFTLPKNVIEGIGIGDVRLYVQGTNLFTLTKYSGLDPDLNNGWDGAFGVDLGNYPVLKQYLVGLHVGF
jgi:TonB-linked SusC/RagA family outer membrane protein